MSPRAGVDGCGNPRLHRCLNPRTVLPYTDYVIRAACDMHVCMYVYIYIYMYIVSINICKYYVSLFSIFSQDTGYPG